MFSEEELFEVGKCNPAEFAECVKLNVQYLNCFYKEITSVIFGISYSAVTSLIFQQLSGN